MEELKSIQGFYITRMGGALYWGVTREKRGSRSSCIAELKSMDECIKGETLPPCFAVCHVDRRFEASDL